MEDREILCFSEKTFSETIIDVNIERMTLQGTVNKVGMSLLLVLLTASYTWSMYFSNGPTSVAPYMIGGSITGLIFALITIFKRTWAPVTAPIYALAKGFALGGISAMYESLVWWYYHASCDINFCHNVWIAFCI